MIDRINKPLKKQTSTLHPTTNPRGVGILFNTLLSQHKLKNDAALSRLLEITPAALSKLRHGRIEFGPEYILHVHDAFGVPIRDIQAIIGLTPAAPPAELLAMRLNKGDCKPVPFTPETHPASSTPIPTTPKPSTAIRVSAGFQSAYTKGLQNA